MDDYLVKPIRIEELAAALQRTRPRAARRCHRGRGGRTFPPWTWKIQTTRAMAPWATPMDENGLRPTGDAERDWEWLSLKTTLALDP